MYSTKVLVGLIVLTSIIPFPFLQVDISVFHQNKNMAYGVILEYILRLLSASTVGGPQSEKFYWDAQTHRAAAYRTAP